MERIAILVASSPTSDAARRAFHLARTLAAGGNQVTLGLLEDAVHAGTGGAPGLPVGDGAAVLVLAPDLALRGYDPGALLPGCRACNYGDLVDLMMEQSDRTLGVF